MTSGPGHEISRWDGEIGEKWVRHAGALDGMLAPFSRLIVDEIARSGDSVLDIGCGAGALTLALAERFAHVTGVDVSRPLLALARKRGAEKGASVTFVEADAAAFQPEEPVDHLVSRFGVMFFEAPVPAFANLRDALNPGGTLTFVCWRKPRDNPWASLPVEVAEDILGLDNPRPEPHAPGPFAFADKDYLARILGDTGWHSIDIVPVSQPLRIPGESAAEAAKFLVELGPLSGRLKDEGIDTARLVEHLTAALPTDSAGRTELPSQAWLVRARSDHGTA